MLIRYLESYGLWADEKPLFEQNSNVAYFLQGGV